MYKPNNILVTGGCGFIASNFLNYMVNKYPSINFINIDAMYYCASLDNINVSNKKNYYFVKGNINNFSLVSYILHEKNIDTVLHFAAKSHVDDSFLNPLEHSKDNILGTHSLLETCRQYGKIKRFIHVSTDEVYGESKLGENEKQETDILCPTNPYSASKAAAEMLVNSYIHSFNMPIIITRGNNVYGPNQYPEKLIPKFIKLLRENKKVTIHGEGKTLRNFIHVDDVSRAFDVILHNGVLHEIYNIGSDEGNEFTVMQVTEKLVKLIKEGDNLNDWIEYVENRNFNDFRYHISNYKLKKLGWKQKIGFNDGLRKLIDNY